ncbi:hypothetical protein CLV35_3030 [Motilibacter peucedani]|uniref:Uncharacterized protein n=1 Tax=Motilibacter peucedani TaxID=598650 RepID=A0A420XNE8_9ACTN|nr:hypothetical protein [Motilibacter peucedani]RKS72779.1 hypothetical protein CLV35_3030 [Motilibacter peucedani]
MASEDDRLAEVERELAELDERHGIDPSLPTAVVPEEVVDQRRQLEQERDRLRGS